MKWRERLSLIKQLKLAKVNYRLSNKEYNTFPSHPYIHPFRRHQTTAEQATWILNHLEFHMDYKDTPNEETKAFLWEFLFQQLQKNHMDTVARMTSTYTFLNPPTKAVDITSPANKQNNALLPPFNEEARKLQVGMSDLVTHHNPYDSIPEHLFKDVKDFIDE